MSHLSHLESLPDMGVALVHAEALTPREGAVLELLRQGHSNKEIARGLGMSVDGVKYHLRNIYGKLGAVRRTHALALTSGGRVDREMVEVNS